MLNTPQARLTPFAQLSLDHLKDAGSRQFVPERVAKSQRSFTKASPTRKVNGCVNGKPNTGYFYFNFNELYEYAHLHGTNDDGSVATGGDWSMEGRRGWAGGGATQASRSGT